MTSFGDQVFQMGGVPVGGLAQIMGANGKVFVVDPARGSDAYKGTWKKPLATVSAAYAKAVDKRGDMILLLNDGNTSGTAREDDTITWAKDNTHLMGVCAPVMVSQRARISPTTTLGSIVTPQLKVTGHGNMFANLSFFEGDDENGVASVGIEIESGHRNYFKNVSIMNMGDAATGNSGDEAASAHLLLEGAQENVFEDCYIGLDTATRTAANASVRFRKDGSSVACARNLFKRCVFPMMADADAPLFIDANESGCLDRWNMFDQCTFINAIGSTSTAQAVAAAIHASAGGHLVLKDPMAVGVTDWTVGDTALVQILGHTYNTDDVNLGLASGIDVSA